MGAQAGEEVDRDGLPSGGVVLGRGYHRGYRDLLECVEGGVGWIGAFDTQRDHRLRIGYRRGERCGMVPVSHYSSRQRIKPGKSDTCGQWPLARQR